MNRRTKQNMGHDKSAGSNTSQETVESVEPSGAQIQEPQNIRFDSIFGYDDSSHGSINSAKHASWTAYKNRHDDSGQPTATQQSSGLNHIMEQQSVSIEESTNPVQDPLKYKVTTWKFPVLNYAAI
ncbi:20369_t:CDS:2, partial [Racocetra persica]